MKYSLSQDYFETPLFRETVQAYFDTVLQVIWQDYTTTEAKGLFVKDTKEEKGKVLSDHYDMPYATHVLAGLIPALQLYERHLLVKGWANEPIAKVYLKVFILGFTFHDANKLFGIEPLDDAIRYLEPIVGQFKVHEFFTEFDHYQQDIYFLSLSDENRTSVLANSYKLKLDEKYIKRVLAILCRFADKLASIQELYKVEEFYNEVSKAVQQLEGSAQTSFGNLPLSYIKIQPNPYILLGQQAMLAAKKVLEAQGIKIMYALRDGFIYFGENLSTETYAQIRQAYQQESDIAPVPLTKIDAQKCNFGFVGSLPFTVKVLQEVLEALTNKFLLLSPNGQDKIADYEDFMQFIEALVFNLDLPLKWSDENGKLYLFFRETDDLKPPQRRFVKLFCLHKVCWLNAKQHKPWQQDFEAWLKADKAVDITNDDDSFALHSVAEVVTYLRKQAKTPNALLKTVLAFIKTREVCNDKDEEALEQYEQTLQQEIVQVLGKSTDDDAAPDFKTEFFDKYFTALGSSNLGLLEAYAPLVPEKKQMCLFTGGVAHLDYKEDVAFGVKARGFSNRTITTLNNNRNRVSGLFAEENRLRKTNKDFPKDANTVVYIDFFETHLPISRDVLASCLDAKGLNFEVKLNQAVEFDKSAKFQYNLYNLEFVKLKPSIEANFFFVRKMLRMSQILGLRTYVTGIMSPYSAHKEMFCYENAPRFLQQLGWHKVRLVDLEAVLAEIKLVLLLGKNRIEGNLLKIAQSRQAYFTLFYLLSEDDKKKVYPQLLNFIDQHPEKIKGMTVTNQLVKAATAITLGYKSGAEETWLIRTALKYLRLNLKQKYETPAYERAQVIGEIAGSIDRALRNEDGRDKRMEAIEVFAAKVYDELFVKEWKRKLPNLNREKDWVYHFAFYYRKASLDIVRERKAAKIKKQLLEAGEEINETSVRKWLKAEGNEKHAEQYLSIILNNENNN